MNPLRIFGIGAGAVLSMGVLAGTVNAATYQPAWKADVVALLKSEHAQVRIDAKTETWTMVSATSRSAVWLNTLNVLRALGASVHLVRPNHWNAIWPSASPPHRSQSITTRNATVTLNGQALTPRMSVRLSHNTFPMVPLSSLATWIKATHDSLTWNAQTILLHTAAHSSNVSKTWIGGGTATLHVNGTLVASHIPMPMIENAPWIPITAAKTLLEACGWTAASWQGFNVPWAWTATSTSTLTPPPPPAIP